MLGPYIKSRGARGTEMSANAALIIMETYVQGEIILKTSFSYMSQNVKKNIFLAILSPISMYMSNKETI